MEEELSQEDLWRIHRALTRDDAATELVEKVQRVIEAGCGYDVDEDYDEVRDLAGLVANQATRHNTLMEVVTAHQRIIELHQELLEKHEDTIGRLLLAVGTPVEEVPDDEGR